MDILLVEDNQDLGETISDYLIECDFYVDRAKDIRQAKNFLKNKSYDAIVLDRMLPDGNGSDLCIFIKKNYQTPIIMSTAKSQIEDKIEGFDAGTDDYITKPYDLRELEIRLDAITRRGRYTNSKQKIGNLTIDREGMKIWNKNSKEVHCTNTERTIIKTLLENEGKVVSRLDLVDSVRGGEGTRGYENKLDVLMSGLRKKIGKDSIETVKGFGYKLKK